MSSLVKRLSSIGKKKDAPTPSTPATSSSTTAAPAATSSTAAAPAASSTPAAAPAPKPTTAAAPATSTTATMSQAKIALIYHSFYGHVATLAESVAAGLKASGAQVDIYTFAETLPDDVLGKMHANKELGTKYPNITADKLAEYDGFVMGFGTRYGRAPAQVSAFFDTTGGLWAKGALVGKFATFFTSTASQHGGQESTHLTTIPFTTHHGVIYVPPGYQAQELFDTQNVVGGSPYGAAAIAHGDGSRQVTEAEKSIAKLQGTHFGKIVSTYVKGKSA